MLCLRTTHFVTCACCDAPAGRAAFTVILLQVQLCLCITCVVLTAGAALLVHHLCGTDRRGYCCADSVCLQGQQQPRRDVQCIQAAAEQVWASLRNVLGGLVFALLAPSPLPRLHKLAGIVAALIKLQMTGQPTYQRMIDAASKTLNDIISKLPPGLPQTCLCTSPRCIAVRSVGVLWPVRTFARHDARMGGLQSPSIPSYGRHIAAICTDNSTW